MKSKDLVIGAEYAVLGSAQYEKAGVDGGRMTTYVQTETIFTYQRKDWIEAQMERRTSTVLMERTQLKGKMLREDIVGDERYIAIRWVGHGIATYVVEEVSDTVRGGIWHVREIHWGM
jgi:hypothetical protein